MTDVIITVAICLALGGIVTAIIVSMIKNKKNGKSSCGCSCSGCAMNGACHSQKNK